VARKAEEVNEMPGKVVSIANMAKHLTPAQREARMAAEAEMTRGNVRLTAPPGVRNDPAAHGYWKGTVRRMKGLTLLDDLDTEMFAAYCQILSRRDALMETWRAVAARSDAGKDAEERLACFTQADDLLKRLEAQERLALAYGEKLGLTPSGRVRLAKRRAEEKQVDPDDALYGDDVRALPKAGNGATGG
jgi:phage terminase small subunit